MAGSNAVGVLVFVPFVQAAVLLVGAAADAVSTVFGCRAGAACSGIGQGATGYFLGGTAVLHAADVSPPAPPVCNDLLPGNDGLGAGSCCNLPLVVCDAR